MGFFSVAERDFKPLNTTITFEEDDLIAQVRVGVIDNQILQERRTFSAVIEIPGTQLLFPTQVQSITASIEIKDDDSECVCVLYIALLCMYTCLKYVNFKTTVIVIGVETLTPEVVEGEDARVNVEVLFGSLEKEVSVVLNTLDDSAQGT